MKKYQYTVKDLHDTLQIIEKSDKINFGLIAHKNKITMMNNYHTIKQTSTNIIGVIKIIFIYT